ncbi:MAG: hypothetical protein U0990_06925 [Candidatus Nanopelagicales bacterium]|nr:hypothetical protein [Candidatus Nanopelagicales bacterium]MDZ4249809.1 hypothetical protein [Candidatus Nanopelagicales bacterium]
MRTTENLAVNSQYYVGLPQLRRPSATTSASTTTAASAEEAAAASATLPHKKIG